MTLILVHCLSIHRTFLVGTNRWYCILGTAHKTCPSDCLAITFDLCLDHSDLFTFLFFLLPMYEIQELTVHLLPGVSHHLIDAIVIK